MQSTEPPPALRNRHAPGGMHALAQAGKLSFDPAPQQIEHPRNRRQYRDALLLDQPGQARRLQPVFKMHFRHQQRWNPKPHELPEDMAERKRMQNPQRMHQPLVAQVLANFLFQGIERGQHIPVGMHDPLGLPGGAGSKDDLQRGIPRKPRPRADSPGTEGKPPCRQTPARGYPHRASATAPGRPPTTGAAPRPPPAAQIPGSPQRPAELQRFRAECIQRMPLPTPRSCCPKAEPGLLAGGRADRRHGRTAHTAAPDPRNWMKNDDCRGG